MTAQEISENMQRAKCWDARFGLPLFPTTNNPWIYLAYLDRVLSKHLIGAIDREAVFAHFKRCEVDSEKTPGRFRRWPDGRGGRNSWDEIVGAAYMSEKIARRILRYLDSTGGYWNDTSEAPPNHKIKFNVYRLVYLRPWLVARCGVKPSLCAQLIWAGHLLLAIRPNKKPGDQGGRLRNWIMFQAMREYPICRAAIKRWTKEMERAGHTLRDSLAREPRDAFLVSLAPKEWF